MRGPLVTLIALAGILFSAIRLRAAEEPETFNRFPGLSGDAWVKANEAEFNRHFTLWKTSTGKERARHAEAVQFYGWRSEHREALDEIIADGRLAETEIKPPADTRTVPLQILREVKPEPDPGGRPEPVIWRRISPSAFEVWTPREGLLFNRSGQLTHSAKPPRTGGSGREWFGAFLPDGHWLTTELHEGDGRAYIFNAKGRCTHEIKSGDLLHEPVYRGQTHVIPWARSAADGEGWVVRIGSEGGIGETLLEPDGSSRRIKGARSIWQHCMKRQLGVRLTGGITSFSVESDDGKLRLGSFQPGHGDGVGNPIYQFQPSGQTDGEDITTLGHIPSEGHLFGFWPGTHATYVFNGSRTWFFAPDRHHSGWINGERIGDDTDRKSMLFRLPDGRSTTVSPAGQSSTARRFTLPDGRPLHPLELQPDIRLGIFVSASADTDPASRSTHDLVRAADTVYIARWPAD